MAVGLRELLETDAFSNFPSKIAFAVGKDIAGKVVVSDIAKMPHMLIAGSTGSGKSVCINTLIMSILYKAKPSEVKLIHDNDDLRKVVGYALLSLLSSFFELLIISF